MKGFKNIILFVSVLLNAACLSGQSKIQDSVLRNQIFLGDPPVAQFPGGEDSMFAFILKNLEYPTCHADVEGVVYIEFEVDENGKINKITILKSLTAIYDEAVIKMIKKMPHWIPASNNGKPISSQYVLLVKFE